MLKEELKSKLYCKYKRGRGRLRLRAFTGGSWPAKGRIYQRPSTVANDVLISRCHSARIDKTHRGGKKKVQAKGKHTRQDRKGQEWTGQASTAEGSGERGEKVNR